MRARRAAEAVDATEQPFLRTARDSRASETRQEPGTEAGSPQTTMPRRDDEEENETRTKRKVHPGLIEADNEEVAIVVHFETSEPPSKLRTPHVRRLRLKTLDERSDPGTDESGS